jgi:hypothetical protein
MVSTVCRFGLKVRFLTDVVLMPTPPRYFALPRRLMTFPEEVFAPVKWQTRGRGSPWV